MNREVYCFAIFIRAEKVCFRLILHYTRGLANSDKKGRSFRTNGALIPFLTVQSTAPWDNSDYLSASRMLIPFISSR